eukprot:TRINITY_DN3198_c0_g1_i1.p2 TRINITY_DN3198_c0_g1~~TRINITY_DN3198_c0_g1_i1.p2  ORF type:complete len:136 (+),score=18.98 TRINITY_DN3198_c0_g1_i1:193-600(+)
MSTALSLLSGLLFSSAWWLFADGIAVADIKIKFVDWVPGIITTLAFFFIQFANPNDMRTESLFDESRAKRAKLVFFSALFVAFGGVIAAVWILVDRFQDKNDTYPGIAILIQSFLIVLSSILLWLGRTDRNDDEL